MNLDEDGYPSDEALAKISAWPYQDAMACLEFIMELWHWPDAATVTCLREYCYFRLATGGWSGNESLIRALSENHMIHSFTWQHSSAGGLHCYLVPNWAEIDPDPSIYPPKDPQ